MDRRAAEPGASVADLLDATQALIGAERTATDRFGIAVSGGPDSMALLLLAHTAFAGRVEAATFDHQLRAESADEAAVVARECAAIGVPHTILTPDAPIQGTVQAAARAARYAALDHWREAHGIDWLMTAHHADDQLETLAMRLNRGSGVAGLAGIRPVSGRVLRPLLGMRREALAAVARSAGVAVAHDPSNVDDRFDRARMRKALAGCGAVDPVSASRSAANLAQAEEALEWSVRQLAVDRIAQAQDAVTLDSRDLPAEYLRRLLLLAIQRAAPDAGSPRGDALSGLIARLRGGERAMTGDLLIEPDRKLSHIWRIFAAPKRR